MTVPMPLSEPIRIETGLVRGVPSQYNEAVTTFKGIPFAASTGGDNRWKAPQSATPWDSVRDCSQYGPIPPQLPPGPLYLTEEPVPQSEDCLNLNVWTPAGPADVGQAKYPVYVWIYGGKFLWGAGSDPNFDGTWLASQGIVCVTFNYRLGILGWLAHPELSKESGHEASGNYGLLDQIACLEWIQRNITAFGGDPGRVTISGQSAGSACVGYHVYGPLSKGLFHGAIFQSGGRYPRDPLISCLAPSYRSKEQAESEGEMIFKEKGATRVQDLRDMPLEELLVGNHRDDNTMWGPPPFYRACLDGWAFPRTYEESLLTGQVNDVPLLNGQNKDESGNYTHPDFDEDDLKEVAAIKYGDFADRWMSLYGNEPSTLLKWNTATRDHSRVGPHMHNELWSKHAKSPIYIYHFVHAPPYRKVNPTDYEVPKSKGYTYFKGSRTGAYHAAEIPYTFHSLASDPVFRQIDYDVADKVGGYWANFIKTGDPNGPGLRQWPSAAENDRVVMELGEEQKLTPLTATPQREQFWRDWLPAQKPW